jgi:hypothetical protein
MTTSDIVLLFDRGGYSLMILCFVLYFSFRYLTIYLDNFKKKIQQEIEGKCYTVRGDLVEDSTTGAKIINLTIVEKVIKSS